MTSTIEIMILGKSFTKLLAKLEKICEYHIQTAKLSTFFVNSLKKTFTNHYH